MSLAFTRAITYWRVTTRTRFATLRFCRKPTRDSCVQSQEDKVMSNRAIASQGYIHLLVLLFAICVSGTVAATTSATDGSTPLGLQPGAPAGSYPLSGF